MSMRGLTIETVVHHVLSNLLRPITLLLFYWPKVWRAKLRHFSGRKTVLEIIDGEQTFANGRWAIFLIWQPQRTPWYVQNALDVLAQNQVNVLLVVNHGLSADRRRELKSQSAKIMIRDNAGLDIGGYQDATLYLTRRIEAKRILYLNDSIYFFKDGLAPLIQSLISSKADVCSAFENWEIHYHFQSFCFSIASRILHHPDFVKFWENYLPVNSRRWAINKGEVAISRILLPIASSVEVLYTPSIVRNLLGKLPKSDLINIDRYLPRPIRIGPDSARRLPAPSLAAEISDRIAVGSQVHTGGFIFRHLMACPILKRDLVYRLQFTIDDVHHLLQVSNDEGHTHEILDDIRRKGVGTQLRSWKRLQFDAGII